MDINGSDDGCISDQFHFGVNRPQQQVDARNSLRPNIPHLVLVDFKFRWGRFSGAAHLAHVRTKTRFVDFLGFKDMAFRCHASSIHQVLFSDAKTCIHTWNRPINFD